MFDLSSKFNTFYKTDVVLPQDELNELHEKKLLNIQRLKEGLQEYNKENGTSYTIVETCVQGSVAMSTVVQSENDNYDIDVAIVFDIESLGDKGALATRNIVANALRRKTKQFNIEPEVKTSCVRVQYADGYHIDFAIYRRKKNAWNNWSYEHAGSDWSIRGLKDLTEWFKEKNECSDGKMRRVVRLSKMFCNSKSEWDMPSGLCQTVLCEECLQSSYDRIDELFYYTMTAIVDRLESSVSVTAPVDNGRNLTPRKSDEDKMMRWKNHLKSKLDDLNVLFKDDCTLDDAIQVWYGFFYHGYWKDQESEGPFSLSEVRRPVHSFFDPEEFIEDYFPVILKDDVNVSCILEGNGFRPAVIDKFLTRIRKYLPHNMKINCSVTSTTVTAPYDVYWKVKNVGPEAERRNHMRGQIVKKESVSENSNFYGHHYIECYIIKDSICVAKKHVEIPICR